MLWEQYITEPREVTARRKDFYSLLTEEDFSLTCPFGDFSHLPKPVEYLALCPVWWRLDTPERVQCEIIGNVDVAYRAMNVITPHPRWSSREVVMPLFVFDAEDLAGTTSPYLLAALGVLKNAEPIVLCWSRKGLEQSLTQALFHYHPKGAPNPS